MGFKIYLVEDEANLNQVLVSYLEKERWQVTSFLTGEEALGALKQEPHLWILDIMLPDIDGYQLIKEIKARSPHLPVIFISARDADLDRVIGLEMGSEDYISKPFLPRELVIRVRKLLERIYGEQPHSLSSQTLLSPYQIDEGKRMVTVEGEVIELTSKEFDMLLLFMHHKGQAFAREQILARIWGQDYVGSDRVVDDLIRRLRKKMPKLRIETIYGFGYRMMNE